MTSGSKNDDNVQMPKDDESNKAMSKPEHVKLAESYNKDEDAMYDSKNWLAVNN